MTRKAFLFGRSLAAELCPAVQARMLARRFNIPWERVAELSCSLGAADAIALFDADRQAEIEKDWETASLSFRICGSPIEELFLAAAASQGEFQWSKSGTESLVGFWPDADPVYLYQQLVDGKYRIDFAVMGASRVAVELDGHEWHERTKAQAERDKSRDRWLQEIGWKVLRFTGSEVWRDAAACVQEVIRIAGAQ